jgi:hypothetical protein
MNITTLQRAGRKRGEHETGSEQRKPRSVRSINEKGPPFGEPFSILRMVPAPRVEWIFNYLPLMISLKVNILFYL